MHLNRRLFLKFPMLCATASLPSFAGPLRAEEATKPTHPMMHPWQIVPKLEKRTLSIADEAVPAHSFLPRPVEIPPGSTACHIKLTYDQPEILHTAYVSVRVKLGTGNTLSKRESFDEPAEYLAWRPGDDRDLWVTIGLQEGAETGDSFTVFFEGDGFAGPIGCTVTTRPGAQNVLPADMPRHRAPYRLVLPERPDNRLDIAKMRWSDSGYEKNAAQGAACWRSRLPHGYTQPANGETGLYCNSDRFPKLAKSPQSLDRDTTGRPFVRLHSAKFDTPAVFEGQSFPFQAAVLQGERLPEWTHRRGLYQAEIATPSQKGAWSAFWMVGRTKTGALLWPPEIDCMESFNGVYGGTYTPATTSSAQHVGKHGSGKRENIAGLSLQLDRLGFDGSTDLNRDAHTYACLIEDDWITHFIDGVETLQYRNMTDPDNGNEQWGFFPIINVAVKALPNIDYAADERADLRWYALEYYGSGWKLV